MKLINFFKKPNIFRYGKKVLNMKESNEKNDDWLKKILFLIMIALAILFLLVSVPSGIGVFFLNVILWGLFLYFFKKHVFSGMYPFSIMIFAFFVVLLVSFSMIGDSGLENKEPNGEDLEKFVGRTFELKSRNGKLWGVAGITRVEKNKKTKEERLEVLFNIKIKDDLPNNGKCPATPTGCPKGTFHYDYAINLVEPSDDSADTSEGRLSSTMCNKESQPEDPLKYDQELYQCLPEEYPKAIRRPTQHFDAAFVQQHSSIEEFLSLDRLEIYDGSNFWVVEKEMTMDGSTMITGNIDVDKAVVEGKKVADYKFKIEEK